MGFRFRRSIRLLPGVRVNLGLTRASLSIGRRGLTYNIGTKGSRVTVGIPGSGISYTHTMSQSRTSQQTPVALASGGPLIAPTKRFSATPWLIIAFIAGLFYLGTQSNNNKSASPAPAPASNDGGSIVPNVQNANAWANETAVPIPRRRPDARIESVGPPLQLVPQQ
jgi:hypothetical protein